MLSRRLFAAGAAGAPAILADAARAEDRPAELTIDRIKRTKVLRIAALPGEAPYFNKDIASRRLVGHVRRHGQGHRRGFRGTSRVSSN